MESIKLNIETENNELVIRQGEAPKVREFGGFKYSGVIRSVADWVEQKKKNKFKIDLSRATVLVSKNNIQLVLAEDVAEEKTTVSGELKLNPELLKFGINNSNKTYGNQELSRFLKMNRIYFPDLEENMNLVKNLNSFKARVTQEIEDNNDFKGNKKHLFEQQVKTELNFEFTLRLPLFIGEDEVSFKSEINFDITDGSTSFWIESADLKELTMRKEEEIMNREIERLSDFAIIRM